MDFDRNLNVVVDPPDDLSPKGSAPRRRLRSRAAWLIPLLVILPVLTYVATVSGWLDWIAGPQYTQTELDVATAAAEKSGFSSGEDVGYDDGLDEGREAGEETGFQLGHETGERTGFADGYTIGSSEGYDEGYLNGSETSYGIGYQDGCLVLFDLLGTTRIGSWWDYYYSPSYAYYYESGACYSTGYDY